MGGFAVEQQRAEHFLWQKSRNYYFVIRVPKDIQEHYKSSRVVIYLKTNRRDSAVKASRSIAQRLEDYWLSLTLSEAARLPINDLILGGATRTKAVRGRHHW